MTQTIFCSSQDLLLQFPPPILISGISTEYLPFKSHPYIDFTLKALLEMAEWCERQLGPDCLQEPAWTALPLRDQSRDAEKEKNNVDAQLRISQQQGLPLWCRMQMYSREPKQGVIRAPIRTATASPQNTRQLQPNALIHTARVPARGPDLVVWRSFRNYPNTNKWEFNQPQLPLEELRLPMAVLTCWKTSTHTAVL